MIVGRIIELSAKYRVAVVIAYAVLAFIAVLSLRRVLPWWTYRSRH